MEADTHMSSDASHDQDDNTARRILLFSMELPPSPSGAAVVVSNLAPQFGQSEMVIAGEMPSVDLPLIWRDEWPRIHYVLSRWPAGRRGRHLRRRLLLPLIVSRCVSLIRRYRCDRILCIFPKEEYLCAAYLAAKITGAKFYPYFHNTYLENRKGVSRLFARWLQPRVFEQADHVLVMSEGMAQLYRERYPGLKCGPLVHPFNGPIPEFEDPPRPESPFRFVISGNIHESNLDATLRFCDALGSVEDTELTIISGASRGYLESIGVLRKGWQHFTVPANEFLNRLRMADVAVLPHGFTGNFCTEEYQTIFPTKLIEYLFCGRPILAHSPKDCFLTRFLKERRCALIVDVPEKSALIEAIDRLRSDACLRAELVRNALRTAEMFQASRVAEMCRSYLKMADVKPEQLTIVRSV
jgi:glycosyltransferase involved in cell wall biosynthesis